jgi:enterochelin esterase family protein
MKQLILLLFMLSICTSYGQTTVVEDFKPAVTNQPGKEFPKVNSEGRVRASISAPDAHKVQLDISAVKYDLKKDANGV